MKIILTTPHLLREGGVANYYATLKHYFNSDVEYFITGSRADKEGKWTAITRLLKDMWKFHKRLKRHDAQLVHLNPSLGAKAVIRDGMHLLLAKFHGYPTLVFFHGWNEDCEHRIRRSFLTLFRLVYRKADAFVVLGSVFANALRTMGIDKPIHVLTTAVDERFRSLLNKQGESEKGKKEMFRILFLARIERKKGVYEAVEAYRIVHDRHPNIRMTIAGDGAELEPLSEYVSNQGISGVDFPGYVRGDEKYRLLVESDIYLLPTCYGEGLPVSVLEAMAAGLPVITRPIGGLKDVFVEGKTGFMTESRSPRVFAELIERLLEDRALCAEIAKYNSAYATERFMSSSVARKLDNVYEQMVSQTRDSRRRALVPFQRTAT